MGKNTDPELAGLHYTLLIGSFFYPAFYLLDIIIYPAFKYQILSIRIAVVLCFIGIYLSTYKVHKKYLYFLTLLTIFVSALGISLMCFITGDGFSSSYYAGNFLVLVVASVFFRLSLARFIILLSIILAQHFILLSFIPFTLKDLMTNIYFLVSAATITVIIHAIFAMLLKEINALKGLMPICMHCKKIRDDKGYWNQIEMYIADKTNAEFSHGICPECAKNIHGVDLKDEQQKNGISHEGGSGNE